jgi:hypothetical protein
LRAFGAVHVIFDQFTVADARPPHLWNVETSYPGNAFRTWTGTHSSSRILMH